ncbi:MAG: hypothetical protein P1V51_13005 [Deltaproteobacteria bacterium]|nr:hypothetical protein [Deltaproteobacteria bacterium]
MELSAPVRSRCPSSFAGACASSVLALLLLLPAAAAAEENLAPDLGNLFGPPKLELDKPDTESLGDIEMEGKAAPKTPGMAAPTKVTYAVESAALGRGFKIKNKKTGCVAKAALKGFTLEKIPGPTGPFQTCLRLSASDGVVAAIEARIVGPGGIELADASGEVSFARSGKTMDFVIDWTGFVARAPGVHKLEVVLASTARKTVEFEVK